MHHFIMSFTLAFAISLTVSMVADADIPKDATGWGTLTCTNDKGETRDC